MQTPSVVVGEPPPEQRRLLMEELLEYNRRATGCRDDTELYSFIEDASGALIAGLYGWTWGGTCEIALLWVHEDHRGQGIGGGLLEAAERAARELGCDQMVLTTHSFQAPEFYVQRGFEQVGVVEGYPRGHRDLLLRKPLPRAAAS